MTTTLDRRLGVLERAWGAVELRRVASLTPEDAERELANLHERGDLAASRRLMAGLSDATLEAIAGESPELQALSDAELWDIANGASRSERAGAS
jgi:hypothetical protein